jgi:predicted ATPase
MKLTKLYIHNYKSFYDTTIELDKLNIVVGENNSGKSNLIDVLEFIDIAMSKDIERAISDKGGYDKIKNYSAVGEEKVVVRATFSNVNSNFTTTSSKFIFSITQKKDFTYSITFSSTYSLLSICEESNIQYLERDESLKFEDESRIFFTSPIENIKFVASIKRYFDKKKSRVVKFFIKSKKHKPYIKDVLANIYFFNNVYTLSTYYFDAQKIRTLSNQDTRYTKLLKDGSNLGKVLFEIKEKDENLFEAISNALITTVNEIDAVEVQKVLGSYAIGFKERGEEPISIHIVSDGTINFLATMVALHQPIDDSLMLVFEEPERHLHLNAVSYMLQAFRESNKQILITTHSTEIIKYADLKEIVFIYRDSDGDTQSIRADAIPNLEQKMKRLAYERDVTLDELIAEGMIGTFE